MKVFCLRHVHIHYCRVTELAYTDLVRRIGIFRLKERWREGERATRGEGGVERGRGHETSDPTLSLLSLMLRIDESIRTFDRKPNTVFKASRFWRRIAMIRAVGPKTPTTTVAAIGKRSDFTNGWHWQSGLSSCLASSLSGEFLR